MASRTSMPGGRSWTCTRPTLGAEPPAPVVYPAFPIADHALLKTALLQACDARSTVSLRALSITCRLARRSLIPLPRPIPREARLTPCNASEQKSDLFVAGANSARQEDQSRSGETAKDKRSPRRLALSPRSLISCKALRGTAAGWPLPGFRWDLLEVRVRCPSLRGEFTYALLSPPQPTFPVRDFNFDREVRIEYAARDILLLA